MEPNLFRQAGAPSQAFITASQLRSAKGEKRPARMTLQPAAVLNATSSQKTNFQLATRDVLSPLQFVADTLFIVLLGIAAGSGYQFVASKSLGPLTAEAGTGLVIAILFAILTRLAAGEHGTTVTSSFDRIRDVAQSWTLAFAAFVFILFAAKAGSDASRGAVFTFYLAGLPAMALWHVFAPVLLIPLAKRAGYASRDCIVIGDSGDPLLDKFPGELCANGNPTPTVLKFRAFCMASQWAQELASLVARTTKAAHTLAPGEIFICVGSIPAERLAAISRALTVIPRAIYIVPDGVTASLVRCRPTSVGRFVALEARREPLGPVQRAAKRLIDISVAAAALIVLSPLLAIVAAAIKLDTRGPVLFRQTRNGYRGRPFKILKFRSMHVQEDGPVIRQAIRNDARVTNVGRFLRKASIDELPQLVNVLLGDMSLVGPRPHALAHDELYAKSIENYEIRQHVKPGLTGWAQVNGLRGETANQDAMHRRIEFDLWYAVNASLLLDMEIMVRTAIEVCRQRNAY